LSRCSEGRFLSSQPSGQCRWWRSWSVISTMMFGAFGTLTESRATAGATSPRDKPVTAASPAPICSTLRRVLDCAEGETPPPSVCLSLAISPRLGWNPLLRANLAIHSSLPRTSRPSGRPAIYRCRMSLRHFPISVGEELSACACAAPATILQLFAAGTSPDARVANPAIRAKTRGSECRRSATTWPFCLSETNLAPPR
jgi:hypothetical protein